MLFLIFTKKYIRDKYTHVAREKKYKYLFSSQNFFNR